MSLNHLKSIRDGHNMNFEIGAHLVDSDNINTVSLQAQTFNVGKLVLSGNVRTINVSGSATILLSANDIISGVIGFIISGTGTVNLNLDIPTAAVLDAALSSATIPFYFTTTITAVYNTSVVTGNINILLVGKNIAAFDNTSPFSISAYSNVSPLTNYNRFEKTLVFSRNNGGWILYG